MADDRRLAVFGNGDPVAGAILLDMLADRLCHARAKHPLFAVSTDQALEVIGAEYAELRQAIRNCEGGQRERDEALDVVATCLRFILGEHKDGGGMKEKPAGIELYVKLVNGGDFFRRVGEAIFMAARGLKRDPLESLSGCWWQAHFKGFRRLDKGLCAVYHVCRMDCADGGKPEKRLIEV